MDEVAATLKSRTGNGKTGVGTRTTDPEQSFVVSPALTSGRGHRIDSDQPNLVATPADEEAATLTSGGDQAPGVRPPGRRSEDDDNLIIVGAGEDVSADEVVREPQTFDWQLGGGGNDKSWRGHSRTWIEDKPGIARALTRNKTLAVHVPAATAFQQTPQGDVNESDVAPPVLGRGGSVGNNTPMVATSSGRGHWDESEEAATLGTAGSGVHERTLAVEPTAFDWTGDDPANTPGESPPLSAGHAGEIAVGFAPAMSSRGALGEEDEVAPTLASVDSGSSRAASVFTKTHGAQDVEDAELWEEASDVRSLNSTAFATDVVVEEDVAPVRAGAAVRRLTPRECERLQGLPDDWTLLEPGTPDGPRYAAIGDCVTVNAPYWIVSRWRRRELLRGGNG